MSQADEREDEASDVPAPIEALRTVTPSYGPRPDREMDVFGWSVFLGMVLLLLPFLPIIVAVWGISKLLDAVVGR
jgi:hypothetical protein